MPERPLTTEACGHILTNAHCWSPDGRWIVYDLRSDPEGAVFDGCGIERVEVDSGRVERLYTAPAGSGCGVATYSPVRDRIYFIHGPEHPTPDWAYSAAHRRGVWVDAADPGRAVNLDARDLVAPFTPGALRGGTHVHQCSPDGAWVSFTYEDHPLSRFREAGPDHDLNQRNVGVAVPAGPVAVPPTHPRNHGGGLFSVLVTRTTAHPEAGSDQICRACEEAWVGQQGYRRSDGSLQRRALAFQGRVVSADGTAYFELFLVDLPDDLTRPGDGPLAGTETRMPAPPDGVRQRRLTRTADRRHPGLQGPRHWLRSAPDGSLIACLMKDDAGMAQLWTVSPLGGPPVQLSRNPYPVGSAFTWSPDGRHLAHSMDGSVCLTEVEGGTTQRLTVPTGDPAYGPRPLACVFSPDGRRIAYLKPVRGASGLCNQIFVVDRP